MILSGTRPARLIGVRLVDIHGTRFYDIVYAHDDAPAEQRTARIGAESAYADPAPGDAILVSYIMNVVSGIQRRAV
jgi:hypothetical protein